MNLALVFFIKHLHLSGVRVDVDLRMDTKRIGRHAQNSLTILGSIVNVIEGTYIGNILKDPPTQNCKKRSEAQVGET
jgi:hypothetical protein